ncbi:MAG: ABC transporter ATP-binding protein [Clostridia bacterium]|nr:ABC transporter ATP-binding protein [Clostridia bacterium]
MIKTENLTKLFGDSVALENINCTIADGCIYGMVGSNGAGKSTFLRTISGVYKPDSGSATLDGEEIWENPNAKSKIAFVPDDLYYIPGGSLERMAKMYRSLYPQFDTDKFNKLTADLELPKNRGINTFSKGMRRQALTILALSCSPKYVFFDETFDGLDPVMRNYIKQLICEDIVDRGATAIITSHSLRELEDTCDQLALLHRGGLVLESDITDLKTTKYKIQIAFTEDYDRDKFKNIDIVRFTKQGSVANMIVKGSKEETVMKLSAMNPALLDVLPLTLDEVFTYEMEALGYKFNLDD